MKKRITLSNFMINPIIYTPEHYDKNKHCLLSYQLPFLRHCYIICTHRHHTIMESSAQEYQFFYQEAKRLAKQSVNDEEAFMLIMSGKSARRRANPHAHVFIVENRWQKTLVYSFLASKNLVLSINNLIKDYVT